MCQPGGETPALGGAVIVHVVPAQVKAGKMVLAPIVLPWVLDVAVNKIMLSNGKTQEQGTKTHQR